MLTIKTRQLYLKKLGFYDGRVNGKEDKETREAYLALQKKYFTRKQDIDGVYGENTNILLLNAMRVQNRAKNFKLEEFKCNCNGKYCTGYPTYLQIPLLENIQKVRSHYKKPVKITAGLRCKGYNQALNGSIDKSKHMQGKAVDFFIAGQTETETGRLNVMRYWMMLLKSTFAYCYLPTKYRTQRERTAKYMGNAVHGDVK